MVPHDSSAPRAGPRVVLLCAERDAALAHGDGAVLERLGLSTRVLEIGDTMPPLAVLSDSIGLVYLSEGIKGHSARDFFAFLQHAARAQQSLIGIAIDESDEIAETNLALFERVIARGYDPEPMFSSELSAAVLEELDRTGWGSSLAEGGDETRFLPESLVVTCAERTFVIPLDFRGLVTVGRSPTCQIPVPSDFASRLHGCFRVDGIRYLYRDMSRNGTLLYDGHEELLVQDTECELPENAELRIGDVILRLARNSG